MKKLSLVLVILLAFGASIFADDAAEVTMPTVEEAVMAIDDLATVKGILTPTVDGSATLTFGISLDDPMMTGFSNSVSSTLDMTIVDEASVSSGTIGVISLDDYTVTIDETSGLVVTPGTVTADLVFGPLSIAISSAPTVVADAAAYNVAADTGVAGGGTTITYDMDTMSFGLQLASDGDWTSNDNDYAIGVVADVDVSIVSLPIEFAYNLESGNMGFAVAPSLGLMDGALDVDLAFDGDLSAGFAWDMSAGVTYWDVNDADEETYVTASVLMNSLVADDIKISFEFAESGSVDVGWIPVIGAGVTFDIVLSDTPVWDTSVCVDYDDGSGISPDATFTYNSAGTMTLAAGCDFGSALTGFDNTTIALDYATLSMTDGVTSDLGDVTVAVTVAY